MNDIVLIFIVALIVSLALLYIYKSKKDGKKCIGCPDSKNCSGKCSGCSYKCDVKDE